jgi:hypothetical protein
MNNTARQSSKSNARRIAATLAALSVGGTILVGGGHASAQVTPAEGVVCETLGAHAEGTALDCVTTPTGQTWRTKGTRLNPYRIGETATIQTFSGAVWVNSYSIKVTGGKPDATADVTFVPVNKPLAIPAGSRATSAGVVINFLGPKAKPHPSAGMDLVFVDAADVAYTLYAYRTGEQDCSMAFRKLANEAKLTQGSRSGTITGNVCTYVNASAINSTLLMRIKPKSFKRGEPRETWFEFLPASARPVIVPPTPVTDVNPTPVTVRIPTSTTP